MEPLSKKFLIERGVCCGCKCTNCPYWPKHKKGQTLLYEKSPAFLNQENCFSASIQKEDPSQSGRPASSQR
jgi:hypothetical protein